MRRRDLAAGLIVTAFAGAAHAQQLRDIEPANALEQDFLAAFANPAMRPMFRLRLLESYVALALASSASDAAPREVDLPGERRAGLIYTSAARLNSVLGPAAPRTIITGRTALTRLRGKHAALNYGLVPMLTMEPEDIETFLSIGQ